MTHYVDNFGIGIGIDNPTKGAGFQSTINELTTDVVSDGVNVRMRPSDEGRHFVTGKSYKGSFLTGGPGGQEAVFKVFKGSLQLTSYGGPARCALVVCGAEATGGSVPSVSPADFETVAEIDIVSGADGRSHTAYCPSSEFLGPIAA
ncbi:MAG: hypothetical protein AAF409_12950 [Pseudomonadota bacterium]